MFGNRCSRHHELLYISILSTLIALKLSVPMLIFSPYGQSGSMAVEEKVCKAKTTLAIIYPQASDTSGEAQSKIKFIVKA